MDVTLQLRKLPLTEKAELIRYLEDHESWKDLMIIIPQVLSSDDFKCAINKENPAKYKKQDFYTIEDASSRFHRACSEILLREWGNSGRVLPTLGHLKYLLEEAHLYKAADFIAVELMEQGCPPRPQRGAPAPILCNSDEDGETKPPEVGRSGPSSFDVVQNRVKSESGVISNNANVPNLSDLLRSDRISSVMADSPGENRPDLSALLSPSSTTISLLSAPVSNSEGSQG